MAKLRKKTDEDAALIDMSSMIDVVFLLLIFFIVTAKEVIEEAHIAINFPKQESSQASGSSDSIIISILPELSIPSKENGFIVYDANARVYKYGDYEVNLVELSTEIEKLAGIMGEGEDEGKVDIKTHKAAKNYRLIQVLDLCGKLGLKKLNLLYF